MAKLLSFWLNLVANKVSFRAGSVGLKVRAGEDEFETCAYSKMPDVVELSKVPLPVT